MDDTKREELEKACKKEKDHKVRTRMVAVRMVRVINTVNTIAAWRAAEGCKPTQVCPDCVAFLGFAVPERPSCIVLEAASTGLDRLSDDKPNGFATWTAWCPKKSFLPGAAGKASFRCGPARVTVSCGRETCVRIKTFRLGANIQKIQVASERIFMTPTSHNRFMGSDPNKLAVLIDGDNAYLEYIERVMAYTSRHGQVVARRIYGAHDKLDSHLECIKCHGFKPTYAEGQNAADTAMIMDATEMFHSKVADGYCIVTSDNDFAELARRLRKEGTFVAGIGAKDKEISPFKDACNDFTHFEDLPSPDDPDPTIREFVHGWKEAVKEAIRACTKEDGWAFLSDIGNRLKDDGYDLNPVAHCHGGSMSLIGSCPEFEIRTKLNQVRLI